MYLFRGAQLCVFRGLVCFPSSQTENRFSKSNANLISVRPFSPASSVFRVSGAGALPSERRMKGYERLRLIIYNVESRQKQIPAWLINAAFWGVGVSGLISSRQIHLHNQPFYCRMSPLNSKEDVLIITPLYLFSEFGTSFSFLWRCLSHLFCCSAASAQLQMYLFRKTSKLCSLSMDNNGLK